VTEQAVIGATAWCCCWASSRWGSGTAPSAGRAVRGCPATHVARFRPERRHPDPRRQVARAV